MKRVVGGGESMKIIWRLEKYLAVGHLVLISRKEVWDITGSQGSSILQGENSKEM